MARRTTNKKISKRSQGRATGSQPSRGVSYYDAVKGDPRFGFSKESPTLAGPKPSKINTAGTAQELERIASGQPLATDAKMPAPTPTVAPIAEPTPAVAPIQQPEPQQPGTITSQDALAKVQASGVEAPQDAGEARSEVNKAMGTGLSFWKPSANSEQVYSFDAQGNRRALSYDQYIAAGGKADFSNVQAGLPDNAITQQIEENPDYQAVLQAKKEAFDVINQRASLTDEYKKLTKQLGIDSINTELMNMKNVIEGTEDDLRTEITKAGGFATESQVQALTMARNKQLVKNYNSLLETKQMAMESLNTMIGLASQDRQFAMQAAMQKLNIEQEILSYKDRMRDAAANRYNNIIDKLGYSALVQMTGGDPWYQAVIEKTLGLTPGSLQKLAGSGGQAVKWETRTIGSGKGSYPVRFGYDSAGNIVSRINLATGQEMGNGGSSPTSPSPSPSPKPQKVDPKSAMYSQLKTVRGTDGYISPEDWKKALDAWQSAGYSAASFRTNFGNLINPADPQDYK